MIHREHVHFRVLMESFDSGSSEHTVLGHGGSVAAGDVIETTYRGNPERWRVRSITRDDSLTTWCATVTAVPVLRVVGEAEVIPFPVPPRAAITQSSVIPFGR